MPRQHVTLPIEDFGCSGSGAIVVERALTKVPGVLRVYVNAATEMAYVEYDTDRCGPEALRTAIARVGFHAGVPIPL
jgi:copper chaperone CopZ